MPNINKDRKNVFSEWLETLQQESWQLELLISGLALFGIWESRTSLMRLEYYIDSNVVDPYIFYGAAFTFVLWAGWAIFLVNLLAHIIVRGLWIGAIGLRYVSGDIDYSELNYSDVFKRYFKKRIGSFDDYIERLEKLSSVLFSFTFLLFFLFFSFVFANIFFGIIVSVVNSIFYPDFTAGPTPFAMFFGGLFYGLGLLVVIDFFTLGGFKKVKDNTFARAYLALYRFYSTISLSFIYRPLLLNFIDDKYTRRLFFLAFPYALVMLFGLRQLTLERYSFIPSFTNENRYFAYPEKYSINWNNYDDLREDHNRTFTNTDRADKKTNIIIGSLNKYEIEDSHGSLFLRYLRTDSKLLSRQHADFLPFKKTGLRHSTFSRGIVEDSIMTNISLSQTAELRLMLKVVRGESDKIEDEERAKFVQEIEYYKDYTRDDIPALRNHVSQKYDAKKRIYAESRIQGALELIYSNYKISIDEIDYTDSLKYYFYTHPNRHEQGLLCHFSTDHLSTGDHLIHIQRARNDNECVEDCPTMEKYIPFRKI